MKTTLTNTFHGTEVTLVDRHATGVMTLTNAQIRRARQTLCGIAGCTCGGSLGERGPQSVDIDEQGDGNIQLLAK